MAKPRTELPTGEVLGTYRSHDEANAAVQHLAQHDFRVSALAIVGRDVRIVEEVTGMLTWAAAAGRGALTGAWLGLFVGLLLALFGGDESLTSGALLPGIVIGVGFGMLWGIVLKAAGRKRSSVITRPQVMAGSYEIVCPPAVADEARAILARR